jgi:choline kinase
MKVTQGATVDRLHHVFPVTQTVILAAGSGSRLAGTGVPKPLMAVGGVPLIAHALLHARDSGCDEAIVVLGYEQARIRAAIEALPPPLDVRFVESADPSAPNGVSLLAAEPLARPQFFLQMVDHLFGETTLPKLVEEALSHDEDGRVLVDRDPRDLDLDDATKVRQSGSRITAIGKGLTPWDAVDAGCFVLTGAVFDALRSVPESEPRSVSSGMRQLVARGTLGAVDLDGMAWVDVDTPADLVLAEGLIKGSRVRSVRR